KPSDETIVDTFTEFYASFTPGAGTIDRSEWKIYEGIPGGRVGGGDLIKTVQLKGATNRIILPYSLFKEGQSYRWTVKCWDSYGEESELSEKTFTVKTKQELPVSQIGPQVYTVVSLPDSTKGETAIVTNNSTGTVYIRPLKVSNLPVGVRENFANLFDIKIEGIGEGATAKITFEIPGNYAGWLKLVYDNKNQEWVLKSMPGSGDEYAKLTPSTTPGWTKVELQLKDGGTYDFDDIPGTISDPSGALEKPTRDSGGCFIATACFGNYNHPIVKILREFRDRFLLTNKMGKIFVKWYYIHSPKYAEIIAQNSILKGVVILALVPFVIFAYICVKGLILPFILLSLLTILFKKN
ncbi:MAG: hypothetical protein NZ891_04530, partial [bacterium]|nr:hypothetical protein [bacterium]MDW8163990.1 CFI-box-CTERM domain-containing protein [Candidatus Omnitrophota bacterium]